MCSNRTSPSRGPSAINAYPACHYDGEAVSQAQNLPCLALHVHHSDHETTGAVGQERRDEATNRETERVVSSEHARVAYCTSMYVTDPEYIFETPAPCPCLCEPDAGQ